MHRSPPLSDVADPPTRQSIRETTELIRPFVRLTPTVEYGDDSGGVPPVVLKLESMQHAGSFKTRGAFSNLAHRLVPAGGVVAASGGNHGAAVAYAAMKRKVPATIFVPEVASPAKMEQIRSYGARLEVGQHGAVVDVQVRVAAQHQAERSEPW